MKKLLLVSILFGIDAWMVMLGVGIVHAQVLAAMRPIDLGTACLLTMLFGIGSVARREAIES